MRRQIVLLTTMGAILLSCLVADSAGLRRRFRQRHSTPAICPCCPDTPAKGERALPRETSEVEAEHLCEVHDSDGNYIEDIMTAGYGETCELAWAAAKALAIDECENLGEGYTCENCRDGECYEAAKGEGDDEVAPAKPAATHAWKARFVLCLSDGFKVNAVVQREIYWEAVQAARRTGCRRAEQQNDVHGAVVSCRLTVEHVSL